MKRLSDLRLGRNCSNPDWRSKGLSARELEALLPLPELTDDKSAKASDKKLPDRRKKKS